MKLSIITPTFNRKGPLKILFESLVAQGYMRLEWIIVDDGGSDGTATMVREFQREAPFDVIYLWRNNGGKADAVKAGLAFVTGNVVAVVDDDDYFLPAVLQGVAEDFSRIRSDPAICGLSYLCVDSRGKIIGRAFPAESYISDHIECRINQNVWGDKIEFIKSELRERTAMSPFPGERFLSETIAWIALAKDFKTRYINQPLLVKNYVSDGISANWRKLNLSAPRGMALYYLSHLDSRCNLPIRIKYTVAYLAHARLRGQSESIVTTPLSPFLRALCYLPSIMCAFKWQRDITRQRVGNRLVPTV